MENYNPNKPLKEFVEKINTLISEYNRILKEITTIKELEETLNTAFLTRLSKRPAIFGSIQEMKKSDMLVETDVCMVFVETKQVVQVYFIDKIENRPRKEFEKLANPLLGAYKVSTDINAATFVTREEFTSLIKEKISDGDFVDEIITRNVYEQALEKLNKKISKNEDTFRKYQRNNEKGKSNGYASLDEDGKVPLAQLPDSKKYLSEMIDDASHRTVSDIEKAKWNQGIVTSREKIGWDNKLSKDGNASGLYVSYPRGVDESQLSSQNLASVLMLQFQSIKRALENLNRKIDNPSNGQAGQILRKTRTGVEWTNEVLSQKEKEKLSILDRLDISVLSRLTNEDIRKIKSLTLTDEDIRKIKSLTLRDIEKLKSDQTNVFLTQSEYDRLSPTDQEDKSKLYFIKAED